MAHILLLNEQPDRIRGSARLIADADVVIGYHAETGAALILKDRDGDTTVAAA